MASHTEAHEPRRNDQQRFASARSGPLREILLHLAVELLVIAGFALSARSEPSQPYYASYVVNFSGARGSATAVGPALLVTNKHVAGRVGNTGTATDAAGAKHAIRCSVVSHSWDLALCMASDEGLHWAAVARQPPREGDDVWAMGYGAGNNPKLASGVGKLRRLDGNGNYESTLVIQSGDSGSGMFNAAGELVGVNHAVDNRFATRGMVQGYTTSMALPKLTSLLAQYAQQCPEGFCPREQWQDQSPDDSRRNPDGGQNWLKPTQPPGPPVDLSQYAKRDELAAAEKRLQDALDAQRAELDKSMGVQGQAIAKASAAVEATGKQLQETSKQVGQVNTSTTKLTENVALVTTEHKTLVERIKADFSAVDGKIKEAKETGATTARDVATHVVATTVVDRLTNVLPATPSAWMAILPSALVGGPMGIGIAFAGWIVSRRIKRRGVEDLERVLDNLGSKMKERRREGDAPGPFRTVANRVRARRAA